MLAALDALPEPPRPVDLPLFLSVQRTHRIAGRGAVAAGIVAHGRLRPGDPVRVIGVNRSPYGRRPIEVTAFDTQALSLRSFDEPVDLAEAGEAIGVLLRPRGPERETYREIAHGVVVVSPSDADAESHFLARLEFIDDRPASVRTRYLFHAGHAREAGVLPIARVAPIEPGEILVAPVALETPMFAPPGSRFLVRTDRIVALGETASV